MMNAADYYFLISDLSNEQQSYKVRNREESRNSVKQHLFHQSNTDAPWKQMSEICQARFFLRRLPCPRVLSRGFSVRRMPRKVPRKC